MAKVYLQGIPIELSNGAVFCDDARLQASLQTLFERTPNASDLDNTRALLLVRLLGADLDSLDPPHAYEEPLFY
ncbi:MAG: hypothetical protein ACO1RX_09830 [Candidatus Sericytochromatia bacterium]